MKALLIAENERAIENISSVLKNSGYDVIVYKWFLKALDNIEEISPHLILISSEDYPRHWKTLAQFVEAQNGIEKPKIILYTGNDFSDEDRQKAQILGICGLFSQADSKGLEELKNILSNLHPISKPLAVSPKPEELEEPDELITVEKLLTEPIKEIDSLEEELEEDDVPDISWDSADSEDEIKKEQKNMTDIRMMDKTPIPCSFVFTNPITLAMVFGTARNFDGETLEFTPDIPGFIASLPAETRIDVASIKVNDKIENVSAEVIENNTSKLKLKIIRL